MMSLRAFGKMKEWLLQEGHGHQPSRAPRSIQPEVVVYYWDGSAPEGRHVRDISQSGAFIYTSETWCVGTIIRIILQGYHTAVRDDGTSEPTASICIPARVVRQEADGVAVEFVFRNTEEAANFQTFLAAIPAQPPRTQSPRMTSAVQGKP